MSVEPVLIALQAAFLILLYLFVWRVVRSASRDLRAAPPQESFVLAPAQVAAARGDEPVRPGRLVVTKSNVLSSGKAFDTGPVPATIGRADDNAISLAGDDFASGHHARVESARDGVWIVDLGSTNGTFVNGERLNGRTRLHDGDLVQIGDTELKFER
jgi:pSer/pThr/pTyr-binding forkhead associated (FHA) protein